MSETSVHDGEPIELYTFTSPTTTYRYTSNPVDIEVAGNTFVAIPMERSSLEGTSQDDSPVLQITMPVTIQLIQDYAFDIAPRTLDLLLERIQTPTGIAATAWQGQVTAIAIRQRVATIRVPSRFGVGLNQPVPDVFYQSQCNHSLYDSRCQVVRNSFRVQTTVSSVSGTSVTVGSVGANPNDYFKAGEIVRTTDGERRLITAQTGTVLTLNFPFRALNATDAVEIFAGCDRLITTCRDKFSNVVNFGGHPLIPGINVFTEGLK